MPRPKSTNPVKEVFFHIRIEEELRDQFVELCRTNNSTASKVLREAVRNYVKKHSPK